MDLNLKALIDITYLIPIAITLRKIYAPSFETPESIALAVAKVDESCGTMRRVTGRHMPRQPDLRR